jgi:hypothetical protein
MNERFLILCREPSAATEQLVGVLGQFGEVEVISDSPTDDAVFYPDEEMGGFHYLNGFSSSHRNIIAWERAWKHLHLTAGENLGDVWLVEDDVAGSLEAWKELIEQTREEDADLSAVEVMSRDEDPHWPHWLNGQGMFTTQSRSFNPLCRLSPRLVSVALEFRRCHGRFIFQEVLFASLAAEHGFSYLDWKMDDRTAGLFKSFAFRPEVASFTKGICHPVKDPNIHRQICEGVG